MKLHDVAVLTTGGFGIAGVDRAVLDVERVVVESSRGAGLGTFGSGTRATVHDLIVRDAMGVGVAAFGGASMDIERLAVERATGAGLVAVDSGRLSGRDYLLADLESGAQGATSGTVFGEQVVVVGADWGVADEGGLVTLRTVVFSDAPESRDDLPPTPVLVAPEPPR